MNKLMKHRAGDCMNFGFVRVAATVPRLKVAGCAYNAGNIVEMIKKADELDIQFVVFPELSVTAYTCGDLFHQQVLLSEAYAQIESIMNNTAGMGIVSIIGAPLIHCGQLFNCAVVIQDGRIKGVVPKTYIPGHKELNEERWFKSGKDALCDSITLFGCQIPFGVDLIFGDAGNNVCFGIEAGEDLWAPIPPSSYQAIAGANIIFNLSASNDIIGKCEYRRNLVAKQSGKCICGYIYTSCGVDESTTDVVYGGHAIIAENGRILAETERFLRNEQLIYTDIDTERLSNDRLRDTCFTQVVPDFKFRQVQFDLKKVEIEQVKRYISPHPFVPEDYEARSRRCKEAFSIQAAGLAKRIMHTNSKHAIIGISGGLDSTLALLVTARAFDLLNKPRKDIVGITMPGFGTSDKTYENALEIMECMGVNSREVDIKEACIKHFKDIGHDEKEYNVTYENVQARERTQILMDLANKLGGLVIGTGDLSELALGWCTYNGDHMSMYAVNSGIPKTLVKYLIEWAAGNMADEKTGDVLRRVLDVPITPELLPTSACGEISQITEDIIGPYELHDFFLYHMLRYGAPPIKIHFLAKQAFKGKYSSDTINKWLRVFYRRFFSQQFKRSCLPDGPKIGSISLSPRGNWRMPSDADAEAWLKQA